MILAAVIAAFALALGALTAAGAERHHELYRPQFHFTPATNWMNDPNGLVYYEGEYHLFFQHHPSGDTWGNMSWGHAVSRDLVHWRRLPPAIPMEGDEMIFSGSAVVDRENTTGFGTRENPPLVAVYTSARPGSQAQSLVYSTDRGRTWTKYAGNPVLDIGSSEFRDPKVFWYAPEHKWAMAVSMAVEHKIRFYSSPDLKSWRLMSDFGPAIATGGAWECPDLFPLAVDGSAHERKWVLIVNVSAGGVAGGSGAHYFVGDFDGERFTWTTTATVARARWLDFGKDYYAAVTYNDAPGDRRIAVGWMNNWNYANAIPTSPWRSAMSVPRELSLRTIDGSPRLVSQPVAELRTLREPHPYTLGRRDIRPGAWSLPVHGTALEIEADLRPGTADRAGLTVRAGDGEETVIGYDRAAGELYLDRTRAGESGFSPDFPGVQRAPLELRHGTVHLHVLVDWSSVEVFGGDGRAVITDQVFPKATSDGVKLFAAGGTATVEALRIWRLRSSWTAGGRDPAGPAR